MKKEKDTKKGEIRRDMHYDTKSKRKKKTQKDRGKQDFAKLQMKVNRRIQFPPLLK